MKFLFTNHAVKQMFQRSISIEEIKNVLSNGFVIVEYPDDVPYPSQLIFSMCQSRPVHVVYSKNDEEDTIIIITAYEPTTEFWENDFTTRKK